MHVYESNNIRVSGYPLPLKLKIVDDLTIDNPAYVKAKYQRRPTWGIDQKLQLFTYDNDGKVYKRLGIKLPSKPKSAEKDVIDGLLDSIKF